MDVKDAEMLSNKLFDMGAIKASANSFGTSSSGLNLFGDEWKDVECENGKKARILKEPTKAFEIYGKEWSIKVKALTNVLEQIKVNAAVDVQKKITSLFDNLTYVEASLREMYKNSYLTFAATPCEEKSQEEKRRMDRVIGASTILLTGFKMMVESTETKDFDKVILKFLEITEKIANMILEK